MKTYYAEVTKEGSDRINLTPGSVVTFTENELEIVRGIRIVRSARMAYTNKSVIGGGWNAVFDGEEILNPAEDYPTLTIVEVVEE